MAAFVVRKSSDGQFYFNLKADNGQTILTSEMYTTKAACMNGIESVKKNAGNEGAYEKKTASNGQEFFVLKAANHEIIGKSESYSSAAARDGGLASVRTNASGAEVKDETA
jgi:uncharacterized protein YegP (UPF0339 family)